MAIIPASSTIISIERLLEHLGLLPSSRVPRPGSLVVGIL